MNRRPATWLLAVLLVPPACIPSNVVAVQDRFVAAEALVFAPAPGLRLEGLYESIEITGDAAVSLRRIYYLFRVDGTYTAAALAETGGRAGFQVLDGTWSSTDAGLSLDGAEPLRVEEAPGHVRITSAGGAVVLRRSAQQ